MFKKFFSLILIIGGLISTFYGISYSNSSEAQFRNMFARGGIGSGDSYGIIFTAIGIISILIGITLIVFSRKPVRVENKEKNGCDNKNYSEKSKQQHIINENNTIGNYKEKSSELSKIYNLYKNEIYNEQDYRNKKEIWIKSLKSLNFHKVETDFLNEMLPYVKDNILEKSELETIKYIVSGEYAKDKYKEEHKQKIKAEEEARKKREETIDMIKNKTKEVTSNTINKISRIVSDNSNKTIAANNQLLCKCGEKHGEDDIFCNNCGSKIN